MNHPKFQPLVWDLSMELSLRVSGELLSEINELTWGEDSSGGDGVAEDIRRIVEST